MGALDLHYAFSFYDSVIIASELLAERKILYSKDLQHQQIIEGDSL